MNISRLFMLFTLTLDMIGTKLSSQRMPTEEFIYIWGVVVVDGT